MGTLRRPIEVVFQKLKRIEEIILPKALEIPFAGVPEITTERLQLRAFRVSDFEPFAAMWADPEVVKHISGKVSDKEESWRRMLSLSGSWPLLGYGYWVVVDKNDEKFVGIAGFGELLREISPSFIGRPEAGWVFARHAHGRGIATEAMQAAMSWGLARFGKVKPVAIVDPDYPATIRVAEKCGFVKGPLTQYHGEPCLILEYKTCK